jgi:hypothetical protein
MKKKKLMANRAWHADWEGLRSPTIFLKNCRFSNYVNLNRFMYQTAWKMLLIKNVTY